MSESVVGNGFAHYYIIAGLFEMWFENLIPPIYGGITIVDVIKIDRELQIVDLALYVIFDEKTPFKGEK